MKHSLLFKTVSESCNLSCDYCYYMKPTSEVKVPNHMEYWKLKKLIKEYMMYNRGIASFIWQGGEPLLAGLDFFNEVISFEVEFAPPNTFISNAIQTNGTLINEKWAKFLKFYNFLVGVSLDGPRDIHDSRRNFNNGNGSFDAVMRGLNILENYGVDYNILTVVHRGNISRTNALMDFYKQNRFKWIQFLPAMKFNSHNPESPAKYEINAHEYGQFLRETFDWWFKEFMRNATPPFSIRFFDDVLSTYINDDPGFCVISKECINTLIIEQNGDIFPCDFFMSDRWKLGNIGSDDLESITKSDTYKEFRHLKLVLSDKCNTCKWKNKCYGGCPRNRNYRNNEYNIDYFCEAYYDFYEYTRERMKQLACTLKENLERMKLH